MRGGGGWRGAGLAALLGSCQWRPPGAVGSLLFFSFFFSRPSASWPPSFPRLAKLFSPPPPLFPRHSCLVGLPPERLGAPMESGRERAGPGRTPLRWKGRGRPVTCPAPAGPGRARNSSPAGWARRPHALSPRLRRLRFGLFGPAAACVTCGRALQPLQGSRLSYMQDRAFRGGGSGRDIWELTEKNKRGSRRGSRRVQKEAKFAWAGIM